jgi:1-aminocyclopropane-1-carboxylate deaminase/D-cysteine desulfhydrase-like pyridoxal-dependent ACC family enzyme
MIQFKSSPVEKVNFKGFDLLIKRDDLLHKDFSGNKARKFHYFLDNSFPHITKVVSHGSNQSNAMFSLSVLAKSKGWQYQYYTDHISGHLKENPKGNYKYALDNGMQVIQTSKEDIPLKQISLEKNTLFINEGGALKEAAYGIKQLAREIKEYKKNNNLDALKVFLPSGTGTTALFLQKYLDIEVLTCPCVGDSAYLKKQFLELEKDEAFHPVILEPRKKYHFGKLYKSSYELWLQLKEKTGIEFDLLYDPVGWDTLLYHLEKKDIELSCDYLYIHQGGIIGNETMVERYEYKYKNK